MDRRAFLAAGAVAAAFTGDAVEKAQAATKHAKTDPIESARDEDFWLAIRHAFTVDRSIVNFNNGGCSPAPRVSQQAMNRYLEMQNMAPVYYMWRQLDPQVETVRRMLAEDFGCDPEEMAITRNASESLEICQYGIDLEPGDEVITTNQDYPRMINTWKQREKRDGIVLKQIQFDVPTPSMDHLVERFERAITPRTKVMMFCHITNRSGQIFPVARLAKLGRERGIDVIVDGAHAYAQFPMKRDELDCDFYGTSLHKWLLAPIGTGFLYVRKERIKDLWPLMAANEGMEGDIRKFEQIGTHPAANRLAIAESMTFHQSIGVERKAARLRYLRERWTRRLEQLPGVRSLTSDDPRMGNGIGLLEVKGKNPSELVSHLWKEHRILTTPIKTPGEYEGVRVTPNVYSTIQEVDFFCECVEKFLA